MKFVGGCHRRSAKLNLFHQALPGMAITIKHEFRRNLTLKTHTYSSAKTCPRNQVRWNLGALKKNIINNVEKNVNSICAIKYYFENLKPEYFFCFQTTKFSQSEGPARPTPCLRAVARFGLMAGWINATCAICIIT